MWLLYLVLKAFSVSPMHVSEVLLSLRLHIIYVFTYSNNFDE